MLNKLELSHRATKRDSLQGLAALLVNSLPNIRRFTEVSGVVKVRAEAARANTPSAWACLEDLVLQTRAEIARDLLCWDCLSDLIWCFGKV